MFWYCRSFHFSSTYSTPKCQSDQFPQRKMQNTDLSTKTGQSGRTREGAETSELGNPPFSPLMLHSAAVVQWLGNTTEAVQWQHQQRGQQRETAGSSFRPKLHLFTGTQTLAHVVIFTKSFIYTRHVNNISQRVQFELFTLKLSKITIVSSRQKDQRWKNKLTLSLL